MLLQARGDAELRQHLQRLGRRRRAAEVGGVEQLLVDRGFFGHAQAIGHGDDADAVEEGLVVLVGLEHGPFGFVGMGQDRAVERNGAERLGADVIAFLRRGQQRVQHLDRRLEHLDEFQQALVGAAQAAGEGIGVGIVLAEMLELADVDLADERGDILVVLVAGLGLGDGDLAQLVGIELGDFELGDVAAEFVEALDRPRAHDAADAVTLDAVAFGEQIAEFDGAEQAERAFEHRADLVAGLQHIDRMVLHQILEPLGERGLAAADRAQQIENLPLLFEALRRVLEVADDALDRVFHAVEAFEGAGTS